MRKARSRVDVEILAFFQSSSLTRISFSCLLLVSEELFLMRMFPSQSSP